MFKRLDIAVINRSFWPIYPVIGEALMRLVEQQAHTESVGVIMQDHAKIHRHLVEHKRGAKVNFFACKAFSVSSSGILRRVLDALFFAVWVFFVLLLKRPRKVYVSTDPPVVIPFMVMLYCKLFRASYVYHLQDIHPEAANVVIPVNRFVFALLRAMDSLTMRSADSLITITDAMGSEIKARSGTSVKVRTLPNPSVAFDEVIVASTKQVGFTFCGNAGRLQRIPLLIEAIEQYCNAGGELPFVFAGAGIYSSTLQTLANRYPNVSYLGQITPKEAAQLNADYEWALLPIEDAVTRFAFPSKSSSYVFSGALIATICGEQTSVARWVQENKLGVVVKPNVDALVKFFRQVNAKQFRANQFDLERTKLKAELSFEVFVESLTKLISATGSK